MQAAQIDELSLAILRIVLRHQRLAKPLGCTHHPCDRCMSAHRERVAWFLDHQTPVDFVLPAFPGKSPNTSKVLGVGPDMAEDLSLSFLRKLCGEIQNIYAPGARVIICSDGHVFGDLVRITDPDITFYQTKLREIITKAGPGPLHLFGLNDQYPAHTYDMMRTKLIEGYGEDIDELKLRVRTGELVVLYRGLTRFLLEDTDGFDHEKSRAARQRECRERAYGVIQRSRAWGRLIAQRFPAAVRLSIHPQPCGSTKLGIKLLGPPNSCSDNWITPWHSTAVDVGGRFILMKRHQAEALGAKLVYLHGRPSHYVARQSSLSTNTPPCLVA